MLQVQGSISCQTLFFVSEYKLFSVFIRARFMASELNYSDNKKKALVVWTIFRCFSTYRASANFFLQRGRDVNISRLCADVFFGWSLRIISESAVTDKINY